MDHTSTFRVCTIFWTVIHRESSLALSLCGKNCSLIFIIYRSLFMAWLYVSAEDLDLEDTSQLDSDGRNKLFQRGLSFDKQKKRNCALKCYMGCLKGLQKDSKFTLLPQCLRNVRLNSVWFYFVSCSPKKYVCFVWLTVTYQGSPQLYEGEWKCTP